MPFSAHDLRLDYFRIYDIRDCPATERVLTRGQFDRRGQQGVLQGLDLFAACISKNKEPLFDPYSNLTWYRLSQSVPEPTRTVVVRNQFGEATLWIGKVEALLCPAQMLGDGSKPPGKLDHFKVYRVLDYGTPPGVVVDLRDQFAADRVTVDSPAFFAVPVMKEVRGKRYPVNNPKTHLVIYRTRPKPIARRVAAADQFARRWPIQMLRSVALAAPSLKVRWK
ncbi:MAG: hypothetical protein K1Y01_10495 [Vicinamibacteria bacterium]|nr:hypothetical protein [Vicinamibacteria bacterium]